MGVLKDRFLREGYGIANPIVRFLDIKNLVEPF